MSAISSRHRQGLVYTIGIITHQREPIAKPYRHKMPVEMKRLLRERAAKGLDLFTDTQEQGS